jgi:predicted transcriptional regulator YdeE
VDNSGLYSLIIGAMVPPGGAVSPGLVEAQVPGGLRAVFAVNSGHPEQVGDVWRRIWQYEELTKSYVCDYERYQADGRIDIFVGIR